MLPSQLHRNIIYTIYLYNIVSACGKFVCMYVYECLYAASFPTKTIVPSWTDKLSIVSTLRQCKYNVDDTVSTYLTVKDEG